MTDNDHRRHPTIKIIPTPQKQSDSLIHSHPPHILIVLRIAIPPQPTHLCMDWSKSPRNCLSEVWYMTFTSLMSVMRK